MSMLCVSLVPTASAWWNLSYAYEYQLNISYAGSYATHTLQPITVNISNLNGSNTPALAVLYNNSGTWVEQDWEWHFERDGSQSVKSYVNDTIRFLVNLTNNTVNRDYFIYTTDDGSINAKNTSVFLWYDGFELGHITGYENEYLTPSDAIESGEKYLGSYSIKSGIGVARVRFPEAFDSEHIYFGVAMRRSSTTNLVSVAYLEDNARTNAFRLFIDGISYSTEMIKWKEDDVSHPVKPAVREQWYYIMLKGCDTTGSDTVCDGFYVDGVLNDTSIGTTGTVTDVEYFAIYKNTGSGAETFDEIYISDNNFNVYPNLPTINVESEDTQGLNPGISITLNSPVEGYNSTVQTITFNCSYSCTDSSIVNVSLWGNWSGWHRNETNSTLTGSTGTVKFTKSLPNGEYKWNCYGCNNETNCSFAANNHTFSVDADIIEPTIVLNHPPNASSGNLSYILNATITDDKSNSLDVYFYVNTSLLSLSLNRINDTTISLNISAMPISNALDGLQFLFHFDNLSKYGETNTHVYDFSGNGNNGTVSGAVWDNLGCKFGGCYVFDGTDDYINAGTSNLTLTENFTVMAWVNGSKNQAIETLIAKWNIQDNFSSLPFEAFNASNISGYNLGSMYSGTKGYPHPIFDGRYVYWTPNVWDYQHFHTLAIRYDTTLPYKNLSSWEVFNISTATAYSIGAYRDMVYDGRYIYYTPYFEAYIARYDTTGSFNETSSWYVFDAKNVSNCNNQCYGFNGATFDGEFIYYNPYKRNGSVVHFDFIRYNTSKQFNLSSSWDYVNLTGNIDGVSQPTYGYYETIYVNGYVYYSTILDDEFLRFNTSGVFNDTGNWDLRSGGQDGCGISATTDGRYIYFLPYRTAGVTWHGRIQRYDTFGDFNTGGNWVIYDAGSEDGITIRDLQGGIYDGKYIYFIEYHDGTDSQPHILRYDTTKDYTLSSSWDAINYGSVDGLPTEGYKGGCYDGRYIYFGHTATKNPGINGGKDLAHGMALRYDTVKGNNASFRLQINAPMGENEMMGLVKGVMFTISGTNKSYSVIGNNTFDDSELHHIAVTYNGTNLIMYIDGVKEDERVVSPAMSISSSLEDIVIGASTSDSNDFFNGTIDELGILNRTLSASEVLDSYRIKNGTYSWYVNASDGTNVNKSEVRVFTIGSINTAPQITLVSPADNSTSVSLNAVINYTYTDVDNEAGNCVLYNNSDNTAICTNNSVANGTTIHCNSGVGAYSTTFTYYVNCTDGTDMTKSSVWNFTTEAAKISLSYHLPTETNGTTISTNHTEINHSITISDTSNSLDTFRFNISGARNVSSIIYDDDLVLALNFNNNSAIGDNETHVMDISQYGNNGTMHNGTQICGNHSSCPHYVAGRFGQGMSFDGVNDYVDCGNDSSLNITDAVTIEAWIKSSFSGRRWIVSKGGFDQYWIEVSDSGDKSRFYIRDGDDAFHSCLGTTDVTDGLWHQVVGTYDYSEGYARVYVDGKKQATCDFSGKKMKNNPTKKVTVGAASSGAQNFNGSIDEVRIYDRALSADEVWLHYQSEFQKYNATEYRFYDNLTNLADGEYQHYGWANDSAGGEDTSETRFFTVDVPAFSVSLNSPLDDSSLGDVIPDFNFSVSGDRSTYTCELFINDSGYGRVENWCYQESANESTACGGLNTGTYVNTSGWGAGVVNVTDGDWSTAGYGSILGDYLYINYSKPAGSTSNSLWQVKRAVGAAYNLSLSAGCWNQNPLQLRVYDNSADAGSWSFSCFDGVGWSVLSSGVTKGVAEEAMWWSIADGNTSNNTDTVITANTTLSDGHYNWYINCTVDGRTNQSVARTFMVDTTPPVCTIISQTPGDLNHSSNGSFVVKVHCEDATGFNLSALGIGLTLNHSGCMNASWRFPSNTKADGYLDMQRAEHRNEGEWYEGLFSNIWEWSFHDIGCCHMNMTYNGTCAAGYCVNFTFTKQDIHSLFHSFWALDKNSLEHSEMNYLDVYTGNHVISKIYLPKLEANATLIIHTYINDTGAVRDTLGYLCNSSKETDGVTTGSSPNCVYFGSVDRDDSFTYCKGNACYHGFSMFIDENMTVGGVKVEEEMFVIWRSSANLANAWKLGYSDNTTLIGNISFNNSGLLYTSSDHGITFTAHNGTGVVWAAAVHDAVDILTYQIYSIDNSTAKTGGWSGLTKDSIGVVPEAPGTPAINHIDGDTNKNGTYSGVFDIGCLLGEDPNGEPVTGNLSLRNTDGSFNYTINGSFSDNGSMINVSFNSSLVADGTYRMNLTNCDNTSRCSSTLIGNFTIDNTPPYIAFNTSTTAAGNHPQSFIQVNITAHDIGSGIDLINISLYNSTGGLVDSNTSGSSPFLTNFTGLSDGVYYLNATVNDSAGNLNHTPTRTIELNTLPSSITLISPADNNWTLDNPINFTFKYTGGDATENCKLYIDNVLADTNASTKNNTNTLLQAAGVAEGNHTWNVNCTNNAGNQNTSLTRNIYVDRTKPRIPLNSPPNNTYAPSNTPTFNFTVIDMDTNLSCELLIGGAGYGETTALNNTPTTITANHSLPNGVHYWNITCSDELQTNTSKTWNLTVDTIKPHIQLNLPNGTSTNNQTPTFNFTVTDNIDTNMLCELTVDGITYGQIYADNNTITNITANATLSYGTLHWNITCTDNATNQNTSLTYLIQILSPTVSMPAGWNIIGLTRNRTYTAETICQNITGCTVTSNYSGGNYHSHIKGLPFNIFPIKFGYGYFIHLSQATTFLQTGDALVSPTKNITVELEEGWNIIAWANEVTNTTAEAVCIDIPSSYISKYEPATGFTTHLKGNPLNNFTVVGGKGYFVWLNQTRNWTHN